MSHLLVAEVRDALADAGDPVKAPRMRAYMRSAMPYRGVPMPALRRIVRELMRSTPLSSPAERRSAVLSLWDEADYREERYAALQIAGAGPLPSPLPLYRHLVVTGAWWDLVDATAHLVGDLLLDSAGFAEPVLREWAVADDLWLRRTAIICQVGHRASVDRSLLSYAIEQNLDGSSRTTPARSAYGSEFFIRKAIGWALRDHARTDPEWVRAFVADHESLLSGLSRREALKHL